jgi:hypothetical protein
MYPNSAPGKMDGLWVLPIYEREVFPRLGNNTKLLVVPPAYGSRSNCTSNAAGAGVWCTNQTYAQWLELNLGNLSFYKRWAFNETRIAGFDPWPLTQLISPEYGVCHDDSQPCLNPRFANTSMALGLLEMPEVVSAYKVLGEAIVKSTNGP